MFLSQHLKENGCRAAKCLLASNQTKSQERDQGQHAERLEEYGRSSAVR